MSMIILLLIQIQFHFSIMETLQALLHCFGTWGEVKQPHHPRCGSVCFYYIPSYFDLLFINFLIKSETGEIVWIQLVCSAAAWPPDDLEVVLVEAETYL